jgi:hypothetical protein
MAEEKRRQQRERLRVTETASRDTHLSPPEPMKKRAPNAEKVGNGDPAPVEHAGGKTSGDPADSGKYEAKSPFKSRKGDRFS